MQFCFALHHPLTSMERVDPPPPSTCPSYCFNVPMRLTTCNLPAVFNCFGMPSSWAGMQFWQWQPPSHAVGRCFYHIPHTPGRGQKRQAWAGAEADPLSPMLIRTPKKGLCVAGPIVAVFSEATASHQPAIWFIMSLALTWWSPFVRLVGVVQCQFCESPVHQISRFCPHPVGAYHDSLQSLLGLHAVQCQGILHQYPQVYAQWIFHAECPS